MWMGAGRVVVAIVMAAGMVVTLGSGRARADDWYPFYNEDEYTAFYTPPNPLPDIAPGELVRTEPSRLVLEPSGQLGVIEATGTRVMYRSTDAHGRPNVVTGTYFEPFAPWLGQGPRPLIVYGPGTQGQGDQCAPSRQFNQGIHWSPYLDIMVNYEMGFVETLVRRGFAILMTDYEGLGTIGVTHTYVNRLSQGHAMLDAARAARKLPNTSLKPDGPVAFWGYSQGGGAAASAAELAPVYAPELDVVGTYAGAPPADLAELMPFADGSALVGVIGYALNSVFQAYPEAEPKIRALLTPRGHDFVDKTRDQCVGESVTKFMFRHLQPYFNQPLPDLLADPQFRGLLDLQKLGTLKPNAPVLINSNRYDPLVPYGPAVQLGRDWCGRGSDIEFRTNEAPPIFNKVVINHALPMVVDGEPAMRWIADRFNGVPTASNCGQF
ncbi:lipase family protein [Mycolicibacterium gilvum]|uniref:Triacylglycerol lipase n=1 Tax=Mycolicibacterium gilvum TaxID=1804 RepID=A0A378SVJ6_9MYCO|nr:alpha/beta fold hydrolase [Mycolicibacterium gilvum]STZ46375.1 triacylglycerol lipase [Mycolicibacterium gilvum]